MRFVVAAGAIVAFAVATTRGDILATAHERLQASHPRRAKRAHPDSTFARLLAGHATPYLNDHGVVAGNSPIIAPVDFGADPSGAQDSSDAMDAAIQAALSRQTNHTMAGGGRIVDLGNVLIDLQGGEYLVSRPLSIPEWFGNMRIGSGTLRASSAFPRERYLIEVGGDAQLCKQENKQKSCNEKVGFQDLFLDGGFVARGGLELNATMGANVGPDMFFIHFNHAAVTINGGHEAMVHEAWFGKYYYDEKRTDIEGSVGIELFGNDHIVSDVIGFVGTQTGVVSTGGANLLEGVHLWNLGTLQGGVGIFSTAESTRIDDCYLDYTNLVLQDPSHVHVTNGFFLGMATIVLQAGSIGKVEGLLLMSNSWDNYNMPKNDTIVLDERQATFKSVKDLVMLGNTAKTNKFTTRAATVEKSLTLSQATRWEFDFSDAFIFPSIPIQTSTYSITIVSGFARHTARPPNGHTVVVETDVPVDATVTVTASQSISSPGNHALKSELLL